ncbi:MAG TPA: 30S ribosomal protein S16 [Candidatus Limnocylindria bacterium]|nr:30S ribosomal protein S16 [Candidatus Limnocylindria bacterium]
MAVKIRLSRRGTKNVPFFRIVAVDERKKRDGAFLEDLGTYDAKTSSIVLFKKERVDDWVSKGAIVTDTVKKIYKMHKKASNPAEPKPAKTTKKAKAAVEQETKAEA